MERIFLSYTYKPIDVVKQETEDLVKYIKIMIEAMDLRVLDGVDIGGRAIDTEIQKRINDSDALIAIMTPWLDAQGQKVIPQYVQAEYDLALGQEKHAIRIIHDSLPVQGMFTNHEYIVYSAKTQVHTLLKLMQTISYWKKEVGKSLQVKIEPTDIGDRYDANIQGHSCQYQLMINFKQTGWKSAELWNEPGATFAYIPNVPDESKLQLRLSLGDEHWDSPFTDSMGQIKLQKRGDQ